MSTDKLKKTPSRLPAPALFQGPPSHHASATSLLPPADPNKPARDPLIRQRPHLGRDAKRPLPPTGERSEHDGDHLSLTVSNPSAPFIRRQQEANEAADAEALSRAEAIWAEMQNTLEEVELSAIKGPGLSVFGPEHSRALDELHHAQIDLAKAWARSEAEESAQVLEERKSAEGTDAGNMMKNKTRPADAGNTARTRSGSTLERSRLEEETEKDIDLSRKRREANDRYFEKVNQGVLEVVMKLEEVAKAMKGVELESQEIWHDKESVDDTGSITTAPSVT